MAVVEAAAFGSAGLAVVEAAFGSAALGSAGLVAAAGALGSAALGSAGLVAAALGSVGFGGSTTEPLFGGTVVDLLRSVLGVSLTVPLLAGAAV